MKSARQSGRIFRVCKTLRGLQRKTHGIARQQEELKDRRRLRPKYHRNEIAGGLMLAACVPVAWLVVLGLEAMGRFGMTARTALFYLFVTVVSAVAIQYLLLPAMRLVRLGPGWITPRRPALSGAIFPTSKTGCSTRCSSNPQPTPRTKAAGSSSSRPLPSAATNSAPTGSLPRWTLARTGAT